MKAIKETDEDRPDADAVIPNQDPQKWFEISSLELPMPVRCDECLEMIIPKKAILLNGVCFDQRLLYKLRFLPDCKIGPLEKKGPALIKFEGGDGAIMPMRMQE